MTDRRYHGIAVAVAVAACALSVADIEQHYRGAAGTALAVGPANGVAVLCCRWRPATALVAAVAVGAVASAGLTPTSADEPWPWPVSGVFALVAALVLAGCFVPPDRTGLRPTLIVVVAAANSGATINQLVRVGEIRAGELLGPMVLTVSAAFVSDLVRTRRRVGGQLARQAAETASENAARLRGEERARIARELHDVVAHHLSVVVVRADSAPRRVAGLDDVAIAEFRAIGADARESLEQMRRVLRLLRSEGESVGSRAPQPNLTDATRLIADARDAGARIDLAADLPEVGGIAGLVAYRTLQEAITNALRHAPGAPVTVRVDCEARTVRVRVENPASSVAGGDGHGLRGMRERIIAVGGTVVAGVEGSAYRVHAEIPLVTR